MLWSCTYILNVILIFKETPIGTPAYVKPSAEKLQLDRLENSIMKFVREKSVRLIDSHHIQWWTEFFENMNETVLSTPDEPAEDTFQLESLFERPSNNEPIEEVPDDLMTLNNLVNDPEIDVSTE